MDKLKSRKFWATILGAGCVAAGGQFGLPPEASQMVAAIIASYVLGQSYVDGRKK